MSKIIDLAGATLSGAINQSDVTYTNGAMKDVTAKNLKNVRLEGIRLISSGGTNGLTMYNCENVTLNDVSADTDGLMPEKGRHAFFVDGMANLAINRPKVTSARFGLTLKDVEGLSVADGDFTGLHEDAIRLVSVRDGLLQRLQFWGFASPEVGGTTIHPDMIQGWSEKGVALENIVIEDCLMFVGGGTKSQGIFLRSYAGVYADRPDPRRIKIRRNKILCEMGNGLLANGPGGEIVDNYVNGYVGKATTKISIDLDTFDGPITGNRAQHYVDKDEGYQRNWTPDGANERIEPITLEQEAQIVAAWRAKFRPVAPLELELPEGLSPAVLDFLDARYGHAIT